MYEEITILKEEAVAMFGHNASELARALRVSKQTVSGFPPGKPIPERHALRIRYQLKPDLFDS